jgi:hypothetical protein
MLAGTAYPVTSITWNSGTNTGHVLMPNPTTIELGWTLSLRGATNPGGSGDPNSVTNQAPRYVVTAWTNSQDFTVSFERQGFHPTIPTGPLGGSPVFTTIGSDIYSSPTPVSFAAAYVPIPGFMRFTSNGDIIVMEAVSDAIRRIYLSGGSAGTISRVGCFSNFLGQDGVGQFVQVDVDTTGMCGPVDDIFASKIQDAINAAHWTWRMSIDGSYSSTSFTDGWALPNYGPITEVIGGPGHYPWGTFLSKREARMIAVGSAQFQPVMIRQKLPGDPVVDHNFNINFNQAMIESGGQVHYLGSVVGFPREMRPSFYSLRGPTGGGFITNSPGQDTFEDLNATFPTDAGLAAFIQSGMGGMVPRPEIVGNQLRDYIYAIRRGTVAGSLGPTPTQPGPTDNNTTIPLILTCSAVRDSTTQITVTWTTDLPTLGMVAAWAPGQRALGTTPSLFSELESGFGTTHSMPCMVLAGVTPVHFVVVCETQHGIFAHTSDQTVT